MLARSLYFRIIIVAIGAAGVIVAVTLSSILQDRDRTLRTSENHTHNLARTMAEHAARSLDAVDLTLLSIKKQIERDRKTTPRSAQEIIDGFAGYIASLPQIRGLILTDRNGIIRYTERKKCMGMDIHDRKYFKSHRDRPDLGFFVGNPLKGRTTGRWFFSTSRRITDRHGNFDGIAMALVTQGYFAKVYKTTELERNVSLAYTSKSGVVFAASPGFSDDRADVAGKIVDWTRADAASGTYTDSPFPGAKPRIISHVAVPNLPIHIVASIPLDTALAPWRERTVYLLLLVTAALVVLAALTFIASRHARKREAAEAQLSEIFDIAPEALIIIDEDGNIQRFNEGAVKIFGYTATEVMGKPHDLLLPPNLREQHGTDLIGSGEREKRNPSARGRAEIRGRRKDGSEFPASVSVSKFVSNGEAVFTVILQDITERLRSEVALRESEGNFRAIAESSPVPLLITRRSDGRILFANPKVGPMLDVSDDVLIGQNSYDFLWQPEAREGRMVRLEAEGFVAAETLDLRRADGIRISTIFSMQRINYKGEQAILSSFQDVTELQRLEEQLRQAQKMEAVGQLTGGVAHDFNNLLAVIMGNLELLIERAKGDGTSLDLAERAFAATLRGADLTHRLLAFSRRQPLQPVLIDVKHLLRGMQDLLVRTLGENIEIELVGGAGLWSCEADPGQLENTILNLSINARDAMPRGGRLTIETSNARLDDTYTANLPDMDAGQYVLLAVSDTGTGMSAEVVAQAFDPFFTTKDVGKGSGLGLSMIYGFVRQSGGHARIYSELGEGTTIKIYLPRSIAQAERIPESGSSAVIDTAARGETVMVVEDDAEVRAVAFRILEELGYDVLEAGTGHDALLQMESNQGLDLLLADVILPGGMGGRELADKARELWPALQVLYMSGYTENAIMHHGRLDQGVHLLAKPFSKSDLAVKVRQILDNASVPE